MMIAIIDYDAGNICSVVNLLNRLGAEWKLTADKNEIESASHVILPGVGHAAHVMGALRERGLEQTIKNLRRPVLGICAGMQIMCSSSEEGDVECMDIFDCRVKLLEPKPAEKIPHMGWDSLGNLESKLFKDIRKGEMFYFVHSYYAPLCYDTIATCRFGASEPMFSAALRYENFYGVQFHPEKSGEAGEKLIKNFLAL
ncbi:MAG: imidazole glycerol phosphate synthase subunit HisH [Muribaculaceae bacterium]|nr:imidazole glycerol phosphate synthase subunit HisH [Muribaculaceae bacterium]